MAVTVAIALGVDIVVLRYIFIVISLDAEENIGEVLVKENIIAKVDDSIPGVLAPYPYKVKAQVGAIQEHTFG